MRIVVDVIQNGPASRHGTEANYHTDQDFRPARLGRVFEGRWLPSIDQEPAEYPRQRIGRRNPDSIAFVSQSVSVASYSLEILLKSDSQRKDPYVEASPDLLVL
jgi:hypothetical protein